MLIKPLTAAGHERPSAVSFLRGLAARSGFLLAAIGGAIRGALVAQIGIVASYVHLVGPKWLLKTSSGKIARSANREKWMSERGSGTLGDARG